MKLTMKNDYSFQSAMGYADDPDAMSYEEVRKQLGYWEGLVDDALENGHVSNDLAWLGGFIHSLKEAEIEYEKPLEKYGYHAGFEYYDNFEVIAESQEQADEEALKLFKAMAEGMPKRINEAKGCFEYLEQYVPNEGCGDRIYEN